MHPDEDLLQSILRIHWILQDIEHKPVKPVAVAFHEPSEGRFIAPPETVYQFLFVQVRISLMNHIKHSFGDKKKIIDRRN